MVLGSNLRLFGGQLMVVYSAWWVCGFESCLTFGSHWWCSSWSWVRSLYFGGQWCSAWSCVRICLFGGQCQV
jgi:hypothetical protein